MWQQLYYRNAEDLKIHTLTYTRVEDIGRGHKRSTRKQFHCGTEFIESSDDKMPRAPAGPSSKELVEAVMAWLKEYSPGDLLTETEKLFKAQQWRRKRKAHRTPEGTIEWLDAPEDLDWQLRRARALALALTLARAANLPSQR